MKKNLLLKEREREKSAEKQNELNVENVLNVAAVDGADGASARHDTAQHNTASPGRGEWQFVFGEEFMVSVA